MVARAFAQRRKTLRNSLKGLIDAVLLQAQGIDPGQRAEELSVRTFVDLANAASKLGPPTGPACPGAASSR
jgi:16S rRNA (adenine1518-N6/adenine1519-N6)-dimethyltransferase